MVESPQSSWPGVRHPTDQDVPQASHLPGQDFLSRFQRSLLAHGDSEDCRQLFQSHNQQLSSNGASVDLSFTYPLSALAHFPTIPDNNDLLQARIKFNDTLHRHVYLSKITVRSGTDSPLPPDLLLAYACNGNALVNDSHHDPETVFLAAHQLSTFMVETDNRRSRSLDTILAVSISTRYLPCHGKLHTKSAAQIALTVTWGISTAKRSIWEKTESFLTQGLIVSQIPHTRVYITYIISSNARCKMARRHGLFDLRTQAQHRPTSSEKATTTYALACRIPCRPASSV